MSVWWRGRTLSDGDVPLAEDRGFLLGDGLFETVLVLNGAAEFLDRHLARLAASAGRLGVAIPASLDATIAGALPGLVLGEDSPGRGVLRVSVSRGAGRGLTPSPGPPGLVLTFGALPDAEPGAPAPPVTACVLSAPRVDPHDPLAGHKVLSYMPRVNARRLAAGRGVEVALLRTIDGDVCEADAASLFAVIDGEIVTPPLDRGVLPGITRARCLAAAAGAGIAAGQRPIAAADLARAAEVFLTSSLDGVRPVSRLDGRALPAPGAVARWLARCIDPHGARVAELMPPDGLRRAE